jgi:competence protein ComGC
MLKVNLIVILLTLVSNLTYCQYPIVKKIGNDSVVIMTLKQATTINDNFQSNQNTIDSLKTYVYIKDSIINKKKTTYDSLYTVTNQYRVRYDERLNMRIPVAKDNSGWEFAQKLVLVGVIVLQFFTIKR